MIYLFVILLLFVVFLSFSEDYLGKDNKYVYIGLCVLLIFIAGFRPVGLDPDSESYEEIFNNIDSSRTETLVEYSFILISESLKTIIDNIHIVFFFYAFIAISLKFVAIRQLSEFYYLPIVIYLGNYFILHDYTQVRISVASGFMLLAIRPIANGKKLQAMVFLLCALFFHYSSLILFLLLFFNNKPLTRRWKIILISIVPVGILLFLAHADLITFIPIPFIQNKLEIYRTLSEYGIFEEVSLKSPFLWLRTAILLYVLYFYDTIKEHCPYLPVLLKTMGLSLFFFFAFSSIPVLSGRVYELFGIVELILFPTIYYTMKPSYIAKSIVCMIGCVEFIFSIFIWKLLNF